VSVLPIRHYDETGALLVRDGLLLVFFAQLPFPQMASGVEAILTEWLKMVPATAVQWAKVGANAEDISAADSNTLARCRSLLDPKKSQKRAITRFSLEGPEDTNPGFRFQVFGKIEMASDGKLQDTNLVEMRFPTEFLAETGASAFIDAACCMAEAIPYDSGYSSIGLNWPGEAMLRAAAKLIIPLALRHPGFDVHRNIFTRSILARECRGPGWLTFLSGMSIKRLGGNESLRSKLDPGVTIIPAGEGLAIRAGSMPQVGDVNRQENLTLLRSVARAIERVTFFEDTLLESGLFRGDADKFQRWQRRLLV
jgi:hypothetical protein